jgi:hypothetical protein
MRYESLEEEPELFEPVAFSRFPGHGSFIWCGGRIARSPEPPPLNNSHL